MRYFRLQHLPFVIVAFVVGTTGLTFYLAYVKFKHVTYFLPYISDTGTIPPESCIFGQALNLASFLLIFAMYIKYRQVEEIYLKHHIDDEYRINKITFWIGILACVGISVVANFQETNVFWVHWCGAILAFGGGSVYECLQTLVYIKISPVIGQRKTTMFRIILSVISLVSFLVFAIAASVAYRDFKGDDVTKWTKQDGGYATHQISTNAEWICAGATMIYVLLFQPEFNSISLRHIPIVFEEHKSSNVVVNY